VEVQIVGLEDLLRRIVREELAAHQHEHWLTTAEAAEYLGTSRGHVHNLVSKGRLPRHGERGHGLRFTRAELDAYRTGARS